MPKSFPYYRKRHKAIFRNLWAYRRLVLLAILLGLLGWFIWANDDQLTVRFPFGIGSVESSAGWVILVSVLIGAAVSALAMTLVRALRQARRGGHDSEGEHSDSSDKPARDRDPLDDDLPPPDYAAKTEGFSPSHQS